MAMISETNRIINSTKTKPITDVTKLDPNKEYDLTEEGYVEHKDPLKEKWYTTFQAAKELGVTPISIRNAIHMGKIVTKEIPGKSSTGYIHMISETALTEYLEDPHKIRDEKRHLEYNKQKSVYMRGRYKKKDAKNIDIPRPDKFENRPPKLEETPRTIMYDPVSGQQFFANEEEIKKVDIPKEDLKLDVLITHIKALLDNTYKKGFEDGKLSVEHDISDEYRKGFEEGKKQAKEELLAMLKGV